MAIVSSVHCPLLCMVLKHIMFCCGCYVCLGLYSTDLYDTSAVTFYAPFKSDQWLQLPNYIDFVTSLSHLSSYCNMLSVFASGAVTQKAIQTLWTLQVNPAQLSPLINLVTGRTVTMCQHHVQILWTLSEFVGLLNTVENEQDADGLNINHFVPLIEVIGQCDITIDLDGHCSAPHNTEDVECLESEAREDAVINMPVDSHSSADFQAGPCKGILL